MGFFEVASAGQNFAENSGMMGEAFTYQNTSLVGVFNQVSLDYQHADFSMRKITGLVCVSSKWRWEDAGLVPADRQQVVYGGIGYEIQQIAGSNSAGEPCYELTLIKLT
jgi:hypothetical protein